MAITVDAVYEGGVLKPAHSLPLQEHEKVRVTVHSGTCWVSRTAGLMGFTGTAEEAEYYALSPELDPNEDA
jgi:predicted DNA-binding antitoxin AbrB/MazE fold protein